MNDVAQAVLGVSFFGAVAMSIRSMAAVWMKHMETRRSMPPDNAIAQRLERIETAVDVIAVEVERIAEAQRFTARLAAGKPADGRTVTPH